MTLYPVRNQRLPFMFEYYSPGASVPDKRFVLPINPESYKIQHNAKVSVTQTKGGIFVDNFGPGISKISIQGTFGYLGSLPGGGGRHIDGSKVDAWTILKEFEADVFFAFYKEFGSDANPTKKDKAQLQFFNFTDEHFYEVILNPFVVTRSIQRRFLFQYSMELTTIRQLDFVPPEASPNKLRVIDEVDSALFAKWKTVLAGYTSVSNKVSDAINTMQAMQERIGLVAQAISSFREGASAFIAAPFDLVEELITGTDSIIADIGSFREIPHEYTAHLRDLKRTFLQSRLNKHMFKVDSAADTPPATTAAPVVEITTTSVPMSNTDPEISPGENPETTIFASGVEAANSVASHIVEIVDGDTIEAIAVKTLGDSTLWRRIAFLNDLAAPFIVKDTLSGFSAILSEGTLVHSEGKSAVFSGITPASGNVVVFMAEGIWESAVVSSFDDTGIEPLTTLEMALENIFPPGTAVTVHDKALSVLRPGDRIKIPVAGTVTTAPMAGSYTDHLDIIFGADDYLDGDGIPNVDPDGSTATVAGVQNLVMQLQHRLGTPRGALAHLGHKTYGSLIPTMIGKPETDYWLERIRIEAKITILADYRIKSVEQVEIERNADAVSIKAKVKTIGEDSTRTMSLTV
jgi:hypothetical protein